MSDRKSKLIKKYLGEVKSKKQHYAQEGLIIRDQDAVELNSSDSDDSEEENIRGRGRVADSDEE
jgi:hypothetical protein